MPDSNALDRAPPVKRAPLEERSNAFASEMKSKFSSFFYALVYAGAPQAILAPLNRAQTLYQVQNGLKLPSSHRYSSTYDAMLCNHPICFKMGLVGRFPLIFGFLCVLKGSSEDWAAIQKYQGTRALWNGTCVSLTRSILQIYLQEKIYGSFKNYFLVQGPYGDYEVITFWKRREESRLSWVGIAIGEVDGESGRRITLFVFFFGSALPFGLVQNENLRRLLERKRSQHDLPKWKGGSL